MEQMAELAPPGTAPRGLTTSLATVPRLYTFPGHTFSCGNDDLSKGEKKGVAIPSQTYCLHRFSEGLLKLGVTGEHMPRGHMSSRIFSLQAK